jgi:hypothetical protein
MKHFQFSLVLSLWRKHFIFFYVMLSFFQLHIPSCSILHHKSVYHERNSSIKKILQIPEKMEARIVLYFLTKYIPSDDVSTRMRDLCDVSMYRFLQCHVSYRNYAFNYILLTVMLTHASHVEARSFHSHGGMETMFGLVLLEHIQ